MAEASELINGSKTICHYTRFLGFSEPNCNGCNVGNPKMIELLHLFAENRLALPTNHRLAGCATSATTRKAQPNPSPVWRGRHEPALLAGLRAFAR